MPVWLSTLLEIIKVTVPALIVYFTIDRLLRYFFAQQLRLQSAEGRDKSKDATLPLRLQAYERLSLFCERIDLPNLLMRIRPEGLNVKEYRLTLLLAIQQEYEHNITQQVYVSGQLWEIIKFSRDDTVNLINHATGQISGLEEGKKLTETIFNLLAQRGGTAQEKALEAIKKEAALLFG